MDRKTKVATIVGIVFMLILIITSTYAYFMVNTENNTSETIITGKTEKVATASLSQNTSSLKLNLSASDMSLSKVGNYYADDENDYAPNKSLGYHELSTLTLTNSNEDNNIYKCSMNVNVTFDTDVNSIGEAILKDDLKIHFMIGNQNYEYDLSEYKSTGSLSKDIEIELIGNSDKILYGYVELRNKETEQNYLAGKNLNIEINTTLNKCELTGKEGVYVKLDIGWGNEIYKSEEYGEKIKNVYFVNYINNDYESKVYWDMSKTEKDNSADLRISSSKSVIGWLEDSGDSDVPYDLYIGTQKPNQVIFTDSLYRAFTDMPKLESVNFENLNTSLTTDMRMIFSGAQFYSLDLSNFDTSKATDMYAMFYGCSKLQTLNVSSFNTENVTNMKLMFNNLVKLKELDINNFNTSKVTEMSAIIGSTGLSEAILDNFDTSKVTDINSMFAWMSNIRDIDISNFNTSKVTDMRSMFVQGNLNSLKFGENYDTSKVTTMDSIFRLLKIDKLDISMFKSNSLTNTTHMFQNARINLIDMRKMDLTKVTQFEEMFDDFQGNEIIVKDYENKKWIEDRLNEAGVTANVIVAN